MFYPNFLCEFLGYLFIALFIASCSSSHVASPRPPSSIVTHLASQLPTHLHACGACWSADDAFHMSRPAHYGHGREAEMGGAVVTKYFRGDYFGELALENYGANRMATVR